MPRGAKATTPDAICGVMVRANSYWGSVERSKGHCYGASVRLQMVFVERGYEDAHILRLDFAGGNHFAVILDDTVYDLTARQFQPWADEDIPFPYITDLGSYLFFMGGFHEKVVATVEDWT